MAAWIWGCRSPRSGLAGLSWVNASELTPRTRLSTSTATADLCFSVGPSSWFGPRASDRRRQATVEVDRGAGDVRRALGAEESDEVRKLVRLTEPLERHAALRRHLAIERLGIARHPALPLAALHDADPARDGCGDEHLDLVGPRDVALEREQVGAGRAPDEVGGPLEHVLAPRAHRDLRARACEPLGGRSPEALARAGDDRDLAREAQLQIVHGAPKIPPRGELV